MRLPLILSFGLFIAALPVFAAEYYVDPAGADTNDGSAAAPLRTIQRAAELAQAGDSVTIRTGVYRETVRPAHSGTAEAPIVFQAAPGAKVVVSGAEVVTGWRRESGDVWSAPLKGDFFKSSFNQSLQVFVDGEMVDLARWPNATTRPKVYPAGVIPPVTLSTPPKSAFTRFISKKRDEGRRMTTGVFEDDALPEKASAADFKGAQIFVQPNDDGWSWAFTGVVTDKQGKRLTFESRNDSGKDGRQEIYAAYSRYVLYGKREFLDAPGEWFHDTAAGRLYLIPPAGATPDRRTVEAKRRDYAFDLSGRSYITVRGLGVFAATITTDAISGGDARGHAADGSDVYPWRGEAQGMATSRGVVLEGLDVLYPNHFTDRSGHFIFQWGMASGIVLSGEGHRIEDCRIRRTAGNGVLLLGRGHLVKNNLFEDIDYSGVECAAVNTGGPSVSVDHEIAYNTVRRAARSGMTPRMLANTTPEAPRARIHHNLISEYGLQDWDVGGLYIPVSNGHFLRIDHNVVHDAYGFISAGIYIDFGRNYIVDHNVVWNVEVALKFLSNLRGKANILAYNNTAAARNTSDTNFGPFAMGNSSGKSFGSYVANNIFSVATPPDAPGYRAVSGMEDGEVINNLEWDGAGGSATDPRFARPAGRPYQADVDYTLGEGSAAIDRAKPVPVLKRDGVNVPAYNEPSIGGGLDQGAYERGAPAWTAGADVARLPVIFGD